MSEPTLPPIFAGRSETHIAAIMRVYADRPRDGAEYFGNCAKISMCFFCPAASNSSTLDEIYIRAAVAAHLGAIALSASRNED